MRQLDRLFVILLAMPCLLFAQNKKDLEKKKSQIQNEITVTNKMLNETKKNKRISLNQLVTLNKKISMREELITTIGSEINLLGGQINDNEQRVIYLQEELSKLKKDYSAMLLFAQKNRNSYDKMMFIFSSKDFNQAFNRIKYFQQYSEFRKKQAVLIDSTKKNIQEANGYLISKKDDKNKLLLNKEEEKQLLTGEKQEKEKIVTALQSKEKQLKTELAKKQGDANKLNAAIKKIIENEIAKAREEARIAAKAKRKKEKLAEEVNKKENKGNLVKTNEKIKIEDDEKDEDESKEIEIKLTPEAQKLSNSFAANKSKLPWPVSEGLLTSTFGEHPHPVLKGIKVKNNGVDIGTKNNAIVRSVFEGVVSGVISIPGAGKAIIIRHGEYLSVYSNLSNVNVNKGDKVKTKENIGTVLEGDESRGELHFEIWKGSALLNPEQWIAAM